MDCTPDATDDGVGIRFQGIGGKCLLVCKGNTLDGVVLQQPFATLGERRVFGRHQRPPFLPEVVFFVFTAVLLAIC